MTDRPDTILLQALRLEGRHGWGDEERAMPQELEIDLEVEVDLRLAGTRDELDQTLDYGPLVAICQDVVERGSHRLLEAVATTIADRVLALPGALGVTVRVRKLAVPIDADLDFAQVSIHRHPTP